MSTSNTGPVKVLPVGKIEVKHLTYEQIQIHYHREIKIISLIGKLIPDFGNDKLRMALENCILKEPL
jgi:hypothetical protein